MSDLSTLLETGLVSVLFSSIGTGIILFLAQKRIKSTILDGIYEFLDDFSVNNENPDYPRLRAQFSTFFGNFALDFISKFMLEVKNDPEKFVASIKPVIGALFKEIEKDLPKGAQDALATGGIGALAPLLPGKLRKYAGLLQFFTGMGGNPQTSQTGAQNVSNPFNKS